MKVAVCIKQVPVVSRISFDYEAKTIAREGVPLEVNSFDLLAVDRAVQLGRETGAEVVVFTMGPPQAREALIQCLAMGANRAVHLTDRVMAGSDTLATARTLALALEPEAFHLVLCGRNSTDAETGQVGAEIAELLHVSYVSNVRQLEYSADRSYFLAERVVDEGQELIRCPLPAVVSVAEGITQERFPSRQEMAAAREDPAIEEIGAAQLSPDGSIFGAAGSPTWVADIRLVETQRLGVVIEEDDPQIAASKLVAGLVRKASTAPSVEDRGWPSHRTRGEKAIWVIAERTQSGLRRATFELLGKSRELAVHTRSEVVALLMGRGGEGEAGALAAYGADEVFLLGDGHLGHSTGLAATAALCQAIASRNPYAVLFSATANGRDLASRVAARLGLGLTGDCIDLEVNQGGELVQLKPALGGNVVAPILSKTRPYMATLRPGLISPLKPDWSLDAAVTTLEASNVGGLDVPGMEVLEFHPHEDARGIELESARVVMGVGMGVGGPENLPSINRLAQSIGATVAATRNVTDAGWLPKQIQVGLTGKAIAPELYIAVGIRGDFNHTVGIQKAGTVLAINNNPNPRRSPILQAADFTIVGDWQTYLPPLVEALRPIIENVQAR